MNILKRFIYFIPLLLLSFTSISEIKAQEKRTYLQNRYDGYTEVINKKYTKEKLSYLKEKFARLGIIFKFKNIKFNSKKEIKKITLTLKNNKSNASITLNDNKPIPDIKIGEINGIATITLNFKRTYSTFSSIKNN